MCRGDDANSAGGIPPADTNQGEFIEEESPVDLRLQTLLDSKGHSDDVDEIVDLEIFLNYPEYFEWRR